MLAFLLSDGTCHCFVFLDESTVGGETDPQFTSKHTQQPSITSSPKNFPAFYIGMLSKAYNQRAITPSGSRKLNLPTICGNSTLPDIAWKYFPFLECTNCNLSTNGPQQ